MNVNNKGCNATTLKEWALVMCVDNVLQNVKLSTGMVVNDQPQYTVTLREGVNTHEIGAGLAPVEQEWIAQEISAFLAEAAVEIPPTSLDS